MHRLILYQSIEWDDMKHTPEVVLGLWAVYVEAFLPPVESDNHSDLISQEHKQNI